MAAQLASDEEYSAALVENVRLEKEVDALKAMVAHMQSSVADERAGFREQWDALSAEALRLKEDHDALHAKAQALEREKEAASAEHAEQRERWSAQLDAASREFESMREQLIPPSELEAMRLRLVEEATAPWRSRAAEMEAELHAARAEAASARREAERHRAAHESLALEHASAMREAEARHETALAEAMAKLDMALVEETGRAEPLERMRRLQRENTELSSKVERMLEVTIRRDATAPPPPSTHAPPPPEAAANGSGVSHTGMVPHTPPPPPPSTHAPPPRVAGALACIDFSDSCPSPKHPPPAFSFK
jgi:hypothetical protein